MQYFIVHIIHGSSAVSNHTNKIMLDNADKNKNACMDMFRRYITGSHIGSNLGL
jgi:hypothetical protein